MKDLLFQALANAADGAFVIDKAQRIIYWNQAAEEILGYTYDDVVNQPCYEILAGRDDQHRLVCREYCRVRMTALAGEGVTNYDTYVRSKAGDIQWINMSTFIFLNYNHEVGPMLVHLFRDASQKKQDQRFVNQILEAVENLQDEAPSQDIPSISGERQVAGLTNREREVLSLLARGLSTREIAQSLSISPSTARNHIRNILHKLQVHSRLEAVVYAIHYGLISKDQG